MTGENSRCAICGVESTCDQCVANRAAEKARQDVEPESAYNTIAFLQAAARLTRPGARAVHYHDEDGNEIELVKE